MLQVDGIGEVPVSHFTTKAVFLDAARNAQHLEAEYIDSQPMHLITICTCM